MMKRLRTLSRELLDIEILLQDALAIARQKYFEEIKGHNRDIQNCTSDYFAEITTELTAFNEKFREEIIKEKDSLDQQISKTSDEE